MKHLKNLIIACVLLGFTACKEAPANTSIEKKLYKEEVTNVVLDTVQRGIFYKELLNNGKLVAEQKAILPFRQKGEITKIYVHNGQKVEAGDLLATLDNTQQLHAFNEAKRNLEKTRLNLEDALISAGYSVKDSATIPERVYNIAAIKSGYVSAVESLRMRKIELDETKIVAPFSGIISNLEAKAFNFADNYKSFCTLINNTSFDVEFPILETELRQLKAGLNIEAIPFAFASDTFPGKIVSVNPMVDENGMLKVKASLPNKNNALIEGMNVQVLVKIAVPDQIIIPKQAVVLRQERKVVFVCKTDTINNGFLADWHYVEIKDENSQFVSISKGIHPGQKIVVEGNFELAHLSPITPEN